MGIKTDVFPPCNVLMEDRRTGGWDREREKTEEERKRERGRET
ncbi:hypothetical protein AAFF_G00338340 [Aldrovandia affinis]|uniref:Uncharacterized protein n=1 Tax=Aldrovandia affinis TaxID=143900 RepID=A0AAD7R6C4_9TELE|nr:hypothetical protein AAFF_G00338340 [Aldrovandia affinis]